MRLRGDDRGGSRRRVQGDLAERRAPLLRASGLGRLSAHLAAQHVPVGPEIRGGGGKHVRFHPICSTRSPSRRPLSATSDCQFKLGRIRTEVSTGKSKRRSSDDEEAVA
jgi:hypothetical protein